MRVGKGLRGGSFDNSNLQSDFRYSFGPSSIYENEKMGFRVSSSVGTIVPVPEPSTYALMAFGVLALLFALKRRGGC